MFILTLKVNHKVTPKKSKQKVVKLNLKSKPRPKLHNAKTTHSISSSQFFEKFGSKNIKNTKQFNAKSSGLNKRINLFDLLDEQVIYPSIFKDLKIYGEFQCTLIIDKSKINASLSHCQGNQFIKTYTLNILSNILEHQIKINFLKIKLITRFKFSPSPIEHNRSFYADHMFLYKQSFGSETTGAKVAEKSIKVLSHIQNFFTLLEYIPNKKKVLKNKRFLDSIFNSKHFNL